MKVKMLVEIEVEGDNVKAVDEKLMLKCCQVLGDFTFKTNEQPCLPAGMIADKHGKMSYVIMTQQ